ncbi:speckle-type POZ protein B-like isoform X1 [Ostrinia furnacalis]|uniref:speckle-type POZ protein B-like isoform X1 n=1 Tax=Ostrinia furnacalis TaxID=93504 RepID=UPI00103ACC36|nr:speckle-type POZ protein B-like isoform X1 [Ostrinia furnacalis]
MEVENNAEHDALDTIHGHRVCQTRDAKWLCLDNIYQKFHRPNFYDIGGTYIQDVADYWFMYKTEQMSNIFLLHLFVCNRQECMFSVAISRNTDMTIDKKSSSVYLTQSLKEYKFEKTKEMTQNYLTTYSFTNFDIDQLKNRSLYIGVSFNCTDIKGLDQNLIDQVKLNHDFGALMSDPIGADFVIESADGAKFKVHKVLLGAHSEVFKAMLKEETAESQNGFVKLVDVDKGDLQCILECIYTGTIRDLENCNCFNMLMLADRYNIQGLREISQYALSQQLSVDNALDTLMVADMYNSEILKLAALRFIKKNSSVIHSSTFKEIKNTDLMRQLCEYLIPT